MRIFEGFYRSEINLIRKNLFAGCDLNQTDFERKEEKKNFKLAWVYRVDYYYNFNIQDIIIDKESKLTKKTQMLELFAFMIRKFEISHSKTKTQ